MRDLLRENMMTFGQLPLLVVSLLYATARTNGQNCEIAADNPCPLSSGTFSPHDDNTKFIQCVGARCFTMDCPANLVWNQAGGYCDFASNVVVTNPCLGVTCANGWCEAGSCVCNTGYTGEFCELEHNWESGISCPYPNPCIESTAIYHAYPYNNSRFIQCGAASQCFVKECPVNTYWNQDILTCDHTYNLELNCPVDIWELYQGIGICYAEEGGAGNLLQCEGEMAIHLGDQPHEQTAEARHLAFLGATSHIKELSRASIKQNVALKTCRDANPGLTCPNFLAQVAAGTLCTEVVNAIDTCPYHVPTCDTTEEYRSIDGSCNNLVDPLRGTAARAHQRFMPPDYSDCVNNPRTRADGSPLPGARVVSNIVFSSDNPANSSIVTAMHVVYGQITDHDLVETPVATLQNPCSGKLEGIKCGDDHCETSGPENRQCFPILNPVDDEMFSTPPVPCQQFVRSEELPNDNCEAGPRQQGNLITSFSDVSFVYGSETEVAHELRSNVDGKMKVSAHPFNAAFKPLLPTLDDENCRGTDESVRCFTAGDIRVNEMSGLTAMHTVFVRYHNFVAEGLKTQHPTWDDERLYQEARRIVIAVNQNIFGNEYQPVLFGMEWMQAFELGTQATGFFSGYDSSIDATCSNALAGAALRYGHTQLPATTRFSSPNLADFEDVFLTDLFFRPERLYRSGILGNAISGVNAVLIGLSATSASKMDNEITDQVRNSLFTESPIHGQGFDLAALNIQRARDHGLPGYVRWRQFCNNLLTQKGLSNYLMTVPSGTDFDSLADNIPTINLNKLKLAYTTVEDIDLFAGGMSEEPITGGLVGPTFSCIVALDFHNKKFGDRFYFETSDPLLAFTEAQLNKIREQTLASILCETLEDDTSDPDMTLNFQDQVLIQPRALAEHNLDTNGASPARKAAYMALFDNIGDNTRKPCSMHPSLDFTLF